MTLLRTDIGMVQMCKNPWKRGGLYYRGRLAPWIGNPDRLSAAQLARVEALTKTMVDTCTGVTGITGGVVNAALCLQKNIPGKLSAAEKKSKYEARLAARRKGRASRFYPGRGALALPPAK